MLFSSTRKCFAVDDPIPTNIARHSAEYCSISCVMRGTPDTEYWKYYQSDYCGKDGFRKYSPVIDIDHEVKTELFFLYYMSTRA